MEQYGNELASQKLKEDIIRMNTESIFSSDTFDTKAALSGLYLWLLFGYLSTMVSCDLQRWMKDSLLFRHFVGLIAFFFLFTVLDSSNNAPIGALWLKTFFIYFIFLMMVKSKWYFSIPVLLALVADQSLKAHSSYLEKNKESKEDISKIEYYRDMLNKLIITLVVGGFFHYMIRQWLEFGDQFSLSTFLFSYGCANLE